MLPAASNPPDCTPDCPIKAASEVLSGKWTTLIFRDLFGGMRRYSELQASLAGISPRILAERLRQLEELGLVHRRVIPTVPPRTEYRLTDKGRQIEPVLAAMAGFGRLLQGRDDVPGLAGAVEGATLAESAETAR